MQLLVPVDGSKPSMDAVQYATELVHCYDARLEVVHFRGEKSDIGKEVLTKAREILDKENVDADLRVEINPELDFRPGNRIGNLIIQLVEENEYDHVIMGHHGKGAVDNAIIGSATRRVSRAGTVPVTIIP
ncbi:universal stress protein [Haladaptatus caseinilyticus]|uniref:universal stress protein n=1 Tax=Haladaptatus caseinilyticus TaxID=2993314 RepID=UPI00224ABF39|nr:universal stress protein [Haladaptatus caseinilyticus]